MTAISVMEANLVGSIIVQPQLLEQCQALGLRPADFQRATVGYVYGQIVAFTAAHPADLPDEPGPLDPVALAHYIEATGTHPPDGWQWLVLLSKLTDDPSADEYTVGHYARTIIKQAIKRRME